MSTLIQPRAEGIPGELKGRPDWVVWRLEKREDEDEPTKVPYQSNGSHASTTNPRTWAPFPKVWGAFLHGGYSGVGINLRPSLVGVDLDKCRDPDTGSVEPWAMEIVQEVNSYTEASPSGRGIRIFAFGELPPGGRKHGSIEMYSEKRYLTTTGARVIDSPSTVEERTKELAAVHAKHFPQKKPVVEQPQVLRAPVDLGDQELLELAFASKGGDRLRDLMAGAWERHFPEGSPSEAQIVLLNALAFWTRGEAARMDRIFRSSGLMRPKWDERRGGTTHGALEIEKAIAGMDGPGYEPRRRQSTRSTAWEQPIPLSALEVPPFPVDVLPLWLRDWVRAEAVATQTPADLPGLLGLAVLSTATQKAFEIQVREGWREQLSIYVAVVLPPANRKSSVFRDATKPLNEFEADEAARLAPEIRKAEALHRVAASRLKKAEDKAAKGEGDRVLLEQDVAAMAEELALVRIPVTPRLVAADVTSERLATLLRDHGGRMAVMAPEGGVFELMAGRYSESANFEVYLNGHSGDELRVDRVGRPTEIVHKPALVVGLTVQPSLLSGLATKPGFRGRGLLGRFFYAVPESLVGRRDVEAPPVPRYVSEGYRRSVRALLDVHSSRDARGEIVSRVIHVDAEAGAMLTEFSRELEPKLGQAGEFGSLADWAGKLVGNVARLAGILHLGAHAESVENIPAVGVEPMRRAITLGRYLVAQARAAFWEMGTDPTRELARAALEWLRRKQVAKFSRRELHRALDGRVQRAADLDPVLELLQDYGHVRSATSVPTWRPGHGRPPSPRYDVNPLSSVGSVGIAGYSVYTNKEEEEYKDGVLRTKQTELTELPSPPTKPTEPSSPDSPPDEDEDVWPEGRE